MSENSQYPQHWNQHSLRSLVSFSSWDPSLTTTGRDDRWGVGLLLSLRPLNYPFGIHLLLISNFRLWPSCTIPILNAPFSVNATDYVQYHLHSIFSYWSVPFSSFILPTSPTSKLCTHSSWVYILWSPKSTILSVTPCHTHRTHLSIYIILIPWISPLNH